MSTLSLKTSDKSLKNDYYETPCYAVEPLLRYIPNSWKIWECACGEGRGIQTYFIEHGYDVYGSDILLYGSHDFITYYPEFPFDCIVTNPPFSLKTQFLERAKQFRKPFAFLMNITALETERRHKVFSDCGLQLLLPNKRISYIVDGQQTKSAWFYSAWFMFGFNLEHDINYVEIDK